LPGRAGSGLAIGGGESRRGSLLRPPKKTSRDGGCWISVDELLSTKVVHFLSGELQFSVGGHHLGVSAGIRATILAGVVLEAVDLQHDASPRRQQHEEIHPLS
jgi:hypothetical protein